MEHIIDETCADARMQDTGRNPDGTFKKGSEAAKEAGHKSHGGH